MVWQECPIPAGEELFPASLEYIVELVLARIKGSFERLNKHQLGEGLKVEKYPERSLAFFSAGKLDSWMHIRNLSVKFQCLQVLRVLVGVL